MTFKTDHFTGYTEPQLNLYALRDSVGTPFLLLAGLEPDLQWERFVSAVRLLAERLGVRQTIGLGTIPMAVPHTRPVSMTAHSNNRELIADHQPWIGEVQVADNPGRCEPGTGEINYAGIAKALKGMGYDGPVGMEAFAQGDEEAALSAFRNAFTV